MKLDVFITPFFPETENLFKDSFVIMIDVLRAGTSICAAFANGAKEVFPCETTEKAVQIYSNLSKEKRLLGGEKNGIRQSGFDAGNSPKEYSDEAVRGKNVVITTTNGTKTFLKARQARCRIIGAFVNHNAVIEFLKKKIDNIDDDQIKANQPATNQVTINILCAGNNGNLSYEDTICSGSYIDTFMKIYPDAEMTDSAHVAKNLFNLHSAELKTFLGSRQHAEYLKTLGFSGDIDVALSYDIYPVVPMVDGSSIKVEDVA